MGNKELLSETNGTETASIQVLRFQGFVPQNYQNMLISNYLRSLRKGCDFFRLIDPKTYYDVHTKYFTNLLKKPQITLRLLSLPEDKDIALGWSITENDILHYVFLKPDMRRQRLMKLLIPKPPAFITNFTHCFIPIWHAKFPNAVFNPYIEVNK